MIFRFILLASFTFSLLEIGWGKASLMLLKRIGFAIAFGGLVWSTDQILRAPFHLGAGPRLAILASFSAGWLGWMVWRAGEIVFGHDAIRFLLGYADLLPASYVKQLRMQAHWLPGPALVSSRPTEAAG
jgi:hypothetical protein